MRDYAKVAPQFWTGRTGRAIRARGRDAQVVALYVVTAPGANMIGVYYLPVATLCHETGLSPKVAAVALAALEDVGFAFYDAEAEHVWIPEMARFQIGDTLTAAGKHGRPDHRIRGVVRELLSVKGCRFAWDFYVKYQQRYNLPDLPELRTLPNPSEAPSKPLQSQEQEQEQEQEHAQDVSPTASAAPLAPTPLTGELIPNSEISKPNKHPLRALIEAHAARFEALFGAPLTIRWAKDAAIVKPVVDTHGLDVALKLQEQFFNSSDGWWVRKKNYGIGTFVSAVNELAVTGSLNNGNGHSTLGASIVRDAERAADLIRQGRRS